MSLGSLSVVTTVSKCIDFLVGFAIGYSSDNAKTPIGRRKPFIALGGPVAAICMLALVNPPQSILSETVATTHRGDLQLASLSACQRASPRQHSKSK